jgi:hypothetical protein
MTKTELRWDLGPLERLHFRPVTGWMDLHSKPDPHSKTDPHLKTAPQPKSESIPEKRIRLRKTDQHLKSGSAFEKRNHIRNADPHLNCGSPFEMRIPIPNAAKMNPHSKSWFNSKCGPPFQTRLRVQKPQLRETKPSDTQMGVGNIESYRTSTNAYICSYSINSYICFL